MSGFCTNTTLTIGSYCTRSNNSDHTFFQTNIKREVLVLFIGTLTLAPTPCGPSAFCNVFDKCQAVGQLGSSCNSSLYSLSEDCAANLRCIDGTCSAVFASQAGGTCVYGSCAGRCVIYIYIERLRHLSGSFLILYLCSYTCSAAGRCAVPRNLGAKCTIYNHWSYYVPFPDDSCSRVDTQTFCDPRTLRCVFSLPAEQKQVAQVSVQQTSN